MKNTKKDLIWIIPYLIGSIGLSFSAALHIPHIGIGTLNVMEVIYQLGVMLCVLGVGFKGLGSACDELKGALK